MTLDTAVTLWSKVLSRVERFEPLDRQLELHCLLSDIERAGASLEVFVIFCEAFLSHTRF